MTNHTVVINEPRNREHIPARTSVAPVIVCSIHQWILVSVFLRVWFSKRCRGVLTKWKCRWATLSVWTLASGWSNRRSPRCKCTVLDTLQAGCTRQPSSSRAPRRLGINSQVHSTSGKPVWSAFPSWDHRNVSLADECD